VHFAPRFYKLVQNLIIILAFNEEELSEFLLNAYSIGVSVVCQKFDIQPEQLGFTTTRSSGL
jgi:hypothetical protein